eukprot:364743-Chlamydomonas_euryale.AAC.100
MDADIILTTGTSSGSSSTATCVMAVVDPRAVASTSFCACGRALKLAFKVSQRPPGALQHCTMLRFGGG